MGIVTQWLLRVGFISEWVQSQVQFLHEVCGCDLTSVARRVGLTLPNKIGFLLSIWFPGVVTLDQYKVVQLITRPPGRTV